MSLTESQLFTIEALNRIEGFVWPENANHAFMNEDERFVSFTSGRSPNVVVGVFKCMFTGVYAGSVSAECKHPDWRNSLITREQFDSVGGWVRLPDDGEVIKSTLGCELNDSGDKWRYHKPTKETEMQKIEPTKQKLDGWIRLDSEKPDPRVMIEGKTVDGVDYWRYVSNEAEDKQPEPKQPSIEELYDKHDKATALRDDLAKQLTSAENEKHELLEEIKKWHQERGFSISVIGADVSAHANGGELNITDWRDLKAGDIIEAVSSGDVEGWPGGWDIENVGKIFAVLDVRKGRISVDCDNPINPKRETDSGIEFNFIRRP